MTPMPIPIFGTYKPGDFVQLTDRETMRCVKKGDHILWHTRGNPAGVLRPGVDPGRTGAVVEVGKLQLWINASQIVFLT